MYKTVLDFWFKEAGIKKWFVKDTQFDEEIKQRFADVLTQAAAGELSSWRDSAQGRLAEIIVLDQFSRNIYRDTAAAFAQDPVALVLAQNAVATGDLDELSEVECRFLLMPFMHSESKLIHQQAKALFNQHADDDVNHYEVLHKDIIDRFGRYPHRNEILGRESSDEEKEFLTQPNSSF